MKIILPELGEGINDVEVTELIVDKNSVIKKDDILMVVESDKASMEIPSEVSGTITEVFINKGDTINPGDNLFELDSKSDTEINTQDTSQKNDLVEKKEEILNSELINTKNQEYSNDLSNQSVTNNQEEIEVNKVQTMFNSPKTSPLATPSIRKLAREIGCDLENIIGTGKNNRITREDVLNHVKQKVNPNNINETVPSDSNQELSQDFNMPKTVSDHKNQEMSQDTNAPKSVSANNNSNSIKPNTIDENLFLKYGPIIKESFNKVREVTAKRMSESWTTIPHVTHFDELRVDHLIELKKDLESIKKGIKVSFLSFILKALTKTLQEQRIFNSTPDIANNVLIMKEYINIGIAADTPKGLVVPVIHNIDKLSTKKINDQIFDLSKKAKDAKLTPEQMSGGTFTVSSLGGIGGKFFTPIINKPEVAILGVSRIYKKLYLDKYGLTKEANILPFSLSYDHRIIDGADAARFCNLFKSLLGNLETFD